MKTKCWMHSDGKAATVTAIAKALLPQMQLLLEGGNGDFYTSRDMKKGWLVAQVLVISEVCLNLLILDPRGGIFRQTSMVEGLRANVDADVAQWQVPGMKTLEEVLKIVAYKLRVVMSHIRICYDDIAGTDHGLQKHPWAELFAKIKPHGKELPATSSQKKTKGGPSTPIFAISEKR